MVHEGSIPSRPTHTLPRNQVLHTPHWLRSGPPCREAPVRTTSVLRTGHRPHLAQATAHCHATVPRRAPPSLGQDLVIEAVAHGLAVQEAMDSLRSHLSTVLQHQDRRPLSQHAGSRSPAHRLDRMRAYLGRTLAQRGVTIATCGWAPPAPPVPWRHRASPPRERPAVARKSKVAL